MDENQTVQLLKAGNTDCGGVPIVSVVLHNAIGTATVFDLRPAVTIRRQDILEVNLILGPEPEPDPVDRAEALAEARKILEDAGLCATDLLHDWTD